MLASKTGKAFGCVQCFVSFLKLKFMPSRRQFIYILNVLWLLCISTMIFVTDTFDF